jgi:hypothetical protein
MSVEPAHDDVDLLSVPRQIADELLHDDRFEWLDSQAVGDLKKSYMLVKIMGHDRIGKNTQDSAVVTAYVAGLKEAIRQPNYQRAQERGNALRGIESSIDRINKIVEEHTR